MAHNKLFEAAAEILSGTKGKNAMPMAKMPGSDAVDLGGPTPQNSKPTDDSEKIDATKAAKSATAPTTKPSAASPDTQNRVNREQTEVSDEEIVSEEEQTVDITEDIDALFADDSTISEEFKQKAATIFEARLFDRVNQIEEQIEERYASMLEEAVDTIKTDLTEKVNDYLSYVVEQWMEDNEIAIETGLRSELTEEFISGLRNLFAEHYIDVPSEKVDVVEELSHQVDELQTRLNEEIERNVETRSALIEATKQQITVEVTEGLNATQVEKIKTLAESVEFSTEEEYTHKLETIRENYFPSDVKKTDVEQLHEKVEDGTNTVISDYYVDAVSKAISKSKP
jgi:hypothetical protein